MSRARHGLTLVESVVAIFIICGCILVIMRIVSNGIDVNVRAEQVEQGSVIASRQLETLREWAADPAHFYSSASWSAKATGVAFPDSDNSAYSVKLQASGLTVDSPCSQTESRYPLTPRAMVASYKKVAVTVSWSPVSARNTIVLTSIIGAPIDPIESLVVSPMTNLAAPQPVHRNACLNLTVSGWDGTRTVPDLFFLWAQAPITTNGSIGSYQNMSRTGTTGLYENYYCDEILAGVPTAIFGPAGNVSLRVTGRSPAIYDTDPILPQHRWLTNTSANVIVENLVP